MKAAAELKTFEERAVAYLDRRPGTYALLLRLRRRRSIRIGKLGTLLARPGFYVYAGSALGPGGLAARIARHGRNEKTLRWHVDHLRAVATLDEVWYTRDATRRECLWAEVLGTMRGASVPMIGFGSSDCSCRSHLLYFPARPGRRPFVRKLREAIAAHGRVCCTANPSGRSDREILVD